MQNDQEIRTSNGFSVVVFKQDSCRHRDVMVPEPTEICLELRAFREDII